MTKELKEEIEQLRSLLVSLSAKLLGHSATELAAHRPLERADAERLIREAEDCFRCAGIAGLRSEIAKGLEAAGYELMAKAVQIDTLLEHAKKEK